jgi:predicted outer membrane repeat protein
MIPVWFLLHPALAADITVDPAGAPATVQAAIDLAEDGDVILVPAGTHAGCFDLGSRDLSIRGAGATTTTLDGAGCAELARARGGESLDLEALTLTNDGGRCVGVLGGSLALRSVHVIGCGSPGTDGAGVWARSADTLVQDTEFRDNTGDEGAALLSWDGGTLVVQDSHFEDNVASEQGGAIYGNGDVVGTIEDTDFVGNTAPDRVAGAVAWHRGALQITRARFEGNEANLYGGALYAHHVADGVVLEDVAFTGNIATGGDGGAIALAFDAVLQLQGVTLAGNQARDGGAIWASGGSITATDSRFEANQATARGGAIATGDDAALATVGVGFCGHGATVGGTLHLTGGRHRLEQTWIAHTQAGEAGGAVLADTATLAMGWTTIVGAGAPRGAAVDLTGGALDLHSSLLGYTTGGAALVVRGGGVPTGGTNAWWANEGGDTAEDAEDPDAEDVLLDPTLLDWTATGACDALDLRLQRGSPLVDAGRPDAEDPDASRADIGAWGGPAARWTDEDGDGDAYPVDCDDTDATIGPDCTERDSGEDTADTGTPPTTGDGGRKGGSGADAGGCGGGAAGVLSLLLLGLRRRPD